MAAHQTENLRGRVRAPYLTLWGLMSKAGEKHLQCFCVGFDSLKLQTIGSYANWLSSLSDKQVILGSNPRLPIFTLEITRAGAAAILIK